MYLVWVAALPLNSYCLVWKLRTLQQRLATFELFSKYSHSSYPTLTLHVAINNFY